MIKNVLVTGGTSGIGLEIVKLFLSKGYHVHVFGRNEKNLKNINNNLKDFLFFYKVDLMDLDSLKNGCSNIASKVKNIDIIVNSAGYFLLKEIDAVTIEDYNQIFNINLRSSIFIIKFFVKGMKDKKWGRIFNIGSSSCYSGGKLSSLYCASKHGLLGMSRSLSDELKPYGIRVCNISPSSTKTKMGTISLATQQDYETFIDPKEVAQTLLFICNFDGNMEIKELLLNRVNIQ